MSKLADDLHTALMEKLGNNFNKTILLRVRASDLYWFVQLIEAGIEKRKEDWKKANNGKLDVAEIASIGSWIYDLEALVKQIKENVGQTDVLVTNSTKKKVNRHEAIAMLVKKGYKAAPNWSDDKLRAKLESNTTEYTME